MASQISVQKVVAPDSWLVLGATGATTVILLNDTTINYPDGTADILPGNTEAALVGGAATFDRESNVWVLFCFKGDSVLRAQKESLLYLLTQDYCPLGRVLHNQVVPYQPVPALLAASLLTGSWSGGALITSARSWSGRAFYGIFDAQSWSGGATVSGIPFVATSNVTDHTETIGFFVKVAAAPASDMALIDLDAGVSGYLRVKLTSTLHVIAEMSWSAGIGNVDLGGGTAISLNTWYWVTVGQWDNDPGYHITGDVYAPGGATLGGTPQSSYIDDGIQHALSTTAVLNVGRSTSASYLPFPNTAGNEMSKVMIGHNRGNGSLFAPPASDPSGSGLDVLYLARQPVGTAIQLDDTTSNAFNAAASGGLTINGTGPYP